MAKKSRNELKADYVAASQALGIIEKEREALLEPTHDRWWAAVEAQMDAEEALEIHIIGKCEGCLDIILDDEPYHTDGEYYFGKCCAPIAGPELEGLLEAGEKAHEWFEEGKAGYDRYIAYLKTLPPDASLARRDSDD